jgi:hypothetical protein
VPTNKPFALTVLSPIIRGTVEGGGDHAAAIRSVLSKRAREERDKGKRSPLAGISTLHFARWVVIDDVQSQGWPAREEHLRSKYLLFAADFDGPLANFLDCLFYQAHALVRSVWEHCVGFPGVKNQAAFRRYFEDCRLTRPLPFAAYPKSSLPDVLKALYVQRRMLVFIKKNQGKAPADLQRAFVRFMEKVKRAPVPSGGWV